MDVLSLPITTYPPFTLRSALIDKDPLLWVHVLDLFLHLLQILTRENLSLAPRTQQQLAQFLLLYLRESTASGILLLGAINSNITRNEAALKAGVLQLARQHLLVKLGLAGPNVWDFIVCYVAVQPQAVRLLVDGSHHSPFQNNRKSGNVLCIPLVQRHWETLITGNKAGLGQIQVLSALLGVQATSQQTAVVVNKRGAKPAKATVRKDNSRGSSSRFAERFVDTAWVELLEKIYAGGTSVHADTCWAVMVVSVVLLTVQLCSLLAAELGIHTASSALVYPLFCGVVMLSAYRQLFPGAETRMPWITSSAPVMPPASDADVDTLVALFPQLSVGQARVVLAQHGNDVEQATHTMLENPEAGATASTGFSSHQEIHTRLMPSKHQRSLKLADTNKAHRTATLKALEMMYEADEDEPDDTYDDQETTKGAATVGGRITTIADQGDVEEETETAETSSDHAEHYLWQVFKQEPNALMDREERNSSRRKEIRNATKWSNEQIEGWARMLLRNPKRCRLLEEKYTVVGNPNHGVPVEQPRERTPESAGTPSKSLRQRNDRQKASRANHNRKRGHDKKMSRA